MGSCFLPHCLKTPIGGAPGTRCINHQPRHTEASAPSISYSCFHVSSKFSALHLKHSLKCKTVKTSMKSTSGICMEMAVEVAEKLKSKREKTTHLNFRNSSLLFFTFHWKYLAKGAGLTPQHLCAIMKPSARFHKTSTRSGISGSPEFGFPQKPTACVLSHRTQQTSIAPKANGVTITAVLSDHTLKAKWKAAQDCYGRRSKQPASSSYLFHAFVPT